MALTGNVEALYDADQQLMRVIAVPSHFGRIKFPGAKAFGADIKLDIPTAKRIKPNLMALAVFKLRTPAIIERRLVSAELLGVWFYDFETGQVFVKKRPDEGFLDDSGLSAAHKFFQAGRDGDAQREISRTLMLEPTNARAFLLSGRISERRGEQESAIAALRAAIFWESQLIEAHILLGRIYLARGDRREAAKYAASAINIEPNNQEAIALQRQATMGP